jgi:hypothetical protein
MKSIELIQKWQSDKVKQDKPISDIIKDYFGHHNDAIDRINNINNEVTSSINCLDCANCCKTTVTTFNNEDITKASKYLGISKKSFINKYLINDMEEYTTITTPCPFLLEDNKCRIYEVRPVSCRSFPHTHKSNFYALKNVHKENYIICPITYHLINKLETCIE